MQIISRKVAKSQGLKKYFTGKPCKRGHVVERHVSDKSCCQCRSDKSKQWHLDNKEYHDEINRLWYWANRERHLKNNRRWREENRAKYLARIKRYREENRERVNSGIRRWQRRQWATNPEYRMERGMRDMLRRTLNEKTSRTADHLGYAAADLKIHLERQFIKGMSWDNYGEWHIDHITPVSWFIEQGETDPAVINCLSNLRPIWAKDNLSKGDRQTNLI